MISIIVATFNGQEYIKDQLLSIVNQTYNDIEIIIIDDYSIDNTLLIVDEFQKAHEATTIKVFKNKENIGINKTFELGIGQSEGQYIIFCDQDDIWFPNKLEKLYASLNSSNKSVSFCQSLILENNQKTEKIYINSSIESNSFKKLLHNKARGATILIERNYLLSILPFSPYDLYDKWIYFNSLLNNNNNIIALNEPLDYYRVHDNNYTGKKFKFRSKTNLQTKLANNASFYLDLKNKSSSLTITSSNRRTLKELIYFFRFLSKNIVSRNYIKSTKVFIKFVLRNKLSLKNSIIYFYYLFLK